jgi:hypothetical protein
MMNAGATGAGGAPLRSMAAAGPGTYGAERRLVSIRLGDAA